MQVLGATQLLLIVSMFCVERYIRKLIVFSLVQSLFSQQSLENFIFPECCLRQLSRCHQTKKQSLGLVPCTRLVSLSSWVLVFYNSKEFPNWVGSWTWLNSLNIILSGRLISLSSGCSSGKQVGVWCLALRRAMNLQQLLQRVLCVFSPEMGSLVLTFKSLTLEKGQADDSLHSV